MKVLYISKWSFPKGKWVFVGNFSRTMVRGSDRNSIPKFEFWNWLFWGGVCNWRLKLPKTEIRKNSCKESGGTNKPVKSYAISGLLSLCFNLGVQLVKIIITDLIITSIDSFEVLMLCLSPRCHLLVELIQKANRKWVIVVILIKWERQINET